MHGNVQPAARQRCHIAAHCSIVSELGQDSKDREKQDRQEHPRVKYRCISTRQIDSMKPQLIMACQQRALCWGERAGVHDKVRRWRLFRLAPRVHPASSCNRWLGRSSPRPIHLPPSSLHILREHCLPLFCYYSLHHFCARLLHTLISVCLCFPPFHLATSHQFLNHAGGS